MRKSSFGFSQIKISGKVVIGLGGLIVTLLVVIAIDRIRSANNSAPTLPPSPTTPPTGSNGLLTLKNWTTIYNGIDVSKTIVDVSKFKQLKMTPNTGKNLFISSNPSTLGHLFLMNDFNGTSNTDMTPSAGKPIIDINEYNINGYLMYLGLDTTGGGYLNTSLTNFPKSANTNGANMSQIIYSQFNDDGNTFACIANGTYFISFGNITKSIFNVIDGPGNGNKNSYVKMIELNDGSVLLATTSSQLFMSPNMKNKDYKLIKEISAPSRFNVTDFIQLKDGTVVALCNYNNVFIKSMRDLTSKSNWVQINSVNNLPTNLIITQIIELQDGTISVICDDGNLYFLSP